MDGKFERSKGKGFILIVILLLLVLLVSQPIFEFVKAQEPQQNLFGNPSLPDWKNITVTVAGDGKSFTVDNADNLTWSFWYGANKYDSIYQSGVQIVKDELWMLQFYDGSWKDIGSSVNVFYEQVTFYNVRVIQSYSSANGDYNVTWDFYGGFRPKISLSANIAVAGSYRVDWRTSVYKDYCQNMTDYVKFWNSDEEAVVFDYSDVYERFGNITSVEGVEGWVKGKRFDLIFNVGSLPIGLFRLDPNFGYESTSTTFLWFSQNQLKGCMFTSPADAEGATANNITFYAKEDYSGTVNVKAVLVLHSTLAIVSNGVGNPVTVSGTTQAWYTSTFNTPPILSANTAYILMIIPAVGSDNLGLAYVTGDTNQFHSDTSNNYATPTNPTDATHSNSKNSIYCTYTLTETHTTFTHNYWTTSTGATETVIWDVIVIDVDPTTTTSQTSVAYTSIVSTSTTGTSTISASTTLSTTGTTTATSCTTLSTTSTETIWTTTTVTSTSTETSWTTTTLPTTSTSTSLTTTTLPTTSTETSLTCTTLPTTSTSTSLTTTTSETTSTSVSTSLTTTTLPQTSVSTSLTTTTFSTTSISTSLTCTTFQFTETSMSLTTTTTTFTQSHMTVTTLTVMSTVTSSSSTTVTFAVSTQTMTFTTTIRSPGIGINFFAVRVIDWRGSPICNVTVFIRSYGLNQTSNLSTDKDGYAKFQVPNDLYDVWAVTGRTLHTTGYHPGNLIVMQYTWYLLIGDFLVWAPLLIPNWLIILIVAIIIAVALYLFFKSA